MLPVSVSGALTVVLLAVIVWCAYSLVRRPPASALDSVPADVEACHGVMGAAMAVLLSWTPSAAWAWTGCGLFASMALWCVVRASSHRVVRHLRRVGLMAWVMVAMLVPAGAASAAATPQPAGHQTEGMAGMSATQSSVGMLLSGPAAIAVGLMMVLVAGLAVRLALRARDTRSRLSMSCEAAMASVMAVMALLMV